MDAAASPQAPVGGETFTLGRYSPAGPIIGLVFVLLFALPALLLPRPTVGHTPPWGNAAFVVVLAVVAVMCLISLLRPLPSAVTLAERALQVHWPGRIAEHPWERLSLAGGTGREMVRLLDAGKFTGVYLERVAYADRQRFVPLFLSHLDAHSDGALQAPGLLTGEPVCASRGLRHTYTWIALGGLALLLVGLAVAVWNREYQGNSRLSLILWGSICAVRYSHLWWQRTSRTVVFTEEGLLEYRGRSRMPLMRYEAIDCVVVSAELREPVLRVWSGKWLLAVYPQASRLAGARHLMRERATRARWEMW